MAVDVYSENMVGITSPRISFSHDLEQDEHLVNNNNTTRLDHTLLDSTTPLDFAFDLDSTTFFQSLSTADELFSNGKILPTQPKKTPERLLTPCLDPQETEPKKKSLREFLQDSIEEEEPNTPLKSFWKFSRSSSERKRIIGSWKVLSRSGSTGKFLEKIVEEDDETEKPINVKSFWKFGRSNSLNSAIANINDANKGQFRRSSSLNCTISGANHGLIGSFNHHLSRSKSTGCAPNQVGNGKNGKSSSRKGQIRNLKIYGYGNGHSRRESMRVSPILNLPSPYISRVSVDLFGFGSLFCNGSRDRKKKK